MSLNHQESYQSKLNGWLKDVFDFADKLSRKELKNRNCPICNSDQNTFYANNDYFDFVTCQACCHVFMNPIPTNYNVNKGFQGEDELLLKYFEITKEFKLSKKIIFEDALNDKTICEIKKYFTDGNLLDIGCSFGDFLDKAKYFFKVEGIELNPVTACEAEKRHLVHKDFLENLMLEKKFDIITMNQLLYGLPDPVSLLRECHKVLKEDGIIYINTPNSDSYAMQFFQGKANHLYGYQTMNVFGKKSLLKLCDLTGFELVSFQTEWLDIYIPDLLLFLDYDERFIHKKNSFFKDYHKFFEQEDRLNQALNLDLKERGNYLIAILRKKIER